MSELRVETHDKTGPVRSGTPVEWAWEDLQTAQEALEAASRTQAESLSRAALLLVRRRAAQHLDALDAVLKEIGE